MLNCKKIEDKLPLYADGDIEGREKKAIEAHLSLCPACRKAVDDYKLILETYSKIMKEKTVDLEDDPHAWDKLTARIWGSGEDKKTKVPIHSINYYRYFTRPIAIAAGILLLLGIGSIALYRISNSSWQFIIPDRMSVPPTLIGKVKIHHVYLCNHNNITEQPLSGNGEVKTDSLHKATVMLEGKHKIVLDFNTNVRFQKEGDRDYLILLREGKIWGHKEKSGDILLVKTPTTELFVTGTIFEVEIKETCRTILTVAEGKVLFTSANKTIPVDAGCQSIGLQDQSPTQPVKVDITPLSWAERLGTISRNITSILKGTNINPSRTIDNLQSNGKSWFEQRFSTLLVIEDILKQRGEEVNRDILLGLSGSIFQVRFPKNLSNDQLDTKPCQESKAGIENIALFYGYDYEWITENNQILKEKVQGNKYSVLRVDDNYFILKDKQREIPDKRNAILNSLQQAIQYSNEPDDEDYYRGLNAFQKWIESLQKNRSIEEEILWGQDMLLYINNMANYLIDTKTIAHAYLMEASKYFDDSQTKDHIYDIAKRYEDEITRIKGLIEVVLNVVSRDILKDIPMLGSNISLQDDPCGSIIVMSTAAKQQVEDILTNMLMKEKENVEKIEEVMLMGKG